MKLTLEEQMMIYKHRVEERDKNRQPKDYKGPCKYIIYDSDGDHCTKNIGRGVGNHCWAHYGYECDGYCLEKFSKKICPHCGKEI